ncbi:MAG: hypothetical protein AAF821_18700 [Cyanobacteria bacterium P01_D01_bin.156]
MVVMSLCGRKSYYVLVSEWGVKTLVVVRATNPQSAEKIVRQNAGKKDGWEGIRNVYSVFPCE